LLQTFQPRAIKKTQNSSGKARNITETNPYPLLSTAMYAANVNILIMKWHHASMLWQKITTCSVCLFFITMHTVYKRTELDFWSKIKQPVLKFAYSSKNLFLISLFSSI